MITTKTDDKQPLHASGESISAASVAQLPLVDWNCDFSSHACICIVNDFWAVLGLDPEWPPKESSSSLSEA